MTCGCNPIPPKGQGGLHAPLAFAGMVAGTGTVVVTEVALMAAAGAAGVVVVQSSSWLHVVSSMLAVAAGASVADGAAAAAGASSASAAGCSVTAGVAVPSVVSAGSTLRGAMLSNMYLSLLSELNMTLWGNPIPPKGQGGLHAPYAFVGVAGTGVVLSAAGAAAAVAVVAAVVSGRSPEGAADLVLSAGSRVLLIKLHCKGCCVEQNCSKY